MRVSVEPSIRLVIALVVLVLIAVLANRLGQLGQGRSFVVAAIRAAVQLTAIAFVIVLAVPRLWASALFVLAMFAIGVWTTAGRTGTRGRLGWVCLAMASGVLPVLAVIFGLQVTPLNGAALIPIAGIIVGNMMTAHTLTGRRLFSALRDNIGSYEAALSLGLLRSDAISLITTEVAPEALFPMLDQTRTVGLVTLPGAFIGVLLGGGSPLQAGAAQILVLIGIMAGQAITVTVAKRLISAARLLPDDLRARLRP